MPAKGIHSTSASGFDVAVVGGGVIGLSVAWRARARGMSVVVFDRGDLGGGTTRVAAGMLAPASEADAQERALLALGRESARMWGAFADELLDVTGLDVGLRTAGTLAVARDGDEKAALERELDLTRRLGLRAQRLLPSAARALEPALAPSIRLAAEFPDDHSADPRAHGRLILGASVEERGFDTAMTALAVHDLLRDAAEIVPGILDCEIEELVAGLRPGTPDNAPLIGRLDDRVVVATGHHRNGILLAPVTARGSRSSRRSKVAKRPSQNPPTVWIRREVLR